MVQYVKDFWRIMWKMMAVSCIAAVGALVGMEKHWYILASVCGIIIGFCGVIWAPWLEENFKLTHSETKVKALVFGLLEMIFYTWQIPAGLWLWLIFRVPMLVMHSASALCYHHFPNRRMKWFWYCNHAMWNAIAIFNVKLLYTGTSVYNLRPTVLTICITLFWATSFCFKLFRKKQSESVAC